MKMMGLGTASLALPGCINTLSQISSKSRYPNIVYILADDMGYGDLTCLNKASKIPTPNTDRIANEGIRFTDAHSPSAVCSPTRYGVLTGRYSWRTRLKKGVLQVHSPALIDPERMTVASLLKKHGYATTGVGKWHLGLNLVTKDGKPAETGCSNVDFTKPISGGPTDLGFDYFFGIPASLDMSPYFYIENNRVVEMPTLTIEKSARPVFFRGGKIAPCFKHKEVLPTITRKAVSCIEKHADSNPEKPFFLYFPLTAPHTPWVPVDSFKGRSKAGLYGDFVAQVDWTVGQMLKTLDKLKLRDNTLIIVTSDNGAHWEKNYIERYNHRANYHFRGMKADIWDGGHRIPFIARWPGKIKPGSSSNQTICLADLLATCAAIVGEKLPEGAGEDSYNILPALLGEKLDTPIREATVHHSFDGMFAIRQGKWKLILGRGSGGFSKPRRIKPKPGEPLGQLYNLDEDIAETNNLLAERPEVVERLTKLLEKYKRQGHSRRL